MPNVTIFIPVNEMPSDEVFAELTAQCTQLCTDILLAALENVHIIYVPALLGRGHWLFADVRYRLVSFRTEAVMQTFMKSLDEAISSCTGHVARIRCFGYAAESLYARN